MTHLQEAQSKYTIGDLEGNDNLGNPKIYAVIGRMMNADNEDKRDYIDSLANLLHNQPTL